MIQVSGAGTDPGETTAKILASEVLSLSSVTASVQSDRAAVHVICFRAHHSEHVDEAALL